MGPKLPVNYLSLLTATSLATFSITINASGFAIIEQSVSGLGNAFAGGSASAEDVTTVFFNPAGLTRIKGTQGSVAAHVIVPSADFKNQGSYVNPGLTGDTPIAFSLSGSDDDGGASGVVPNLYWVTDVTDRLKFGIGVNAPYALSTEYDDDWVGRYHAIDSEVKTININPSFGYKVNDRLSIGAGISAQYIDATLTNAIDFSTVCLGLEKDEVLDPGTCEVYNLDTPQGADGEIDNSGDDWSLGFNLGALLQLTDNTRVGVHYRSKISHDLEGTGDFTLPTDPAAQGLLNFLPLFKDTPITASVDLPETLSVSLYHEVNPKWAIMGDVTWTRWSRFEELVIEYDNPNQPDSVQPENWDDSYRYALGVTYRPDSQWVYRAGAAYDETPIPNAQDRTPRIPGNNRTWITLGAGYKVDEQVSFDIAYAHIFVDDAKIDSTDISTHHQLVGEYEGSADIVSAQLNWVF